MNETNISFYLRKYRIHVFVDSLRGIGSPRFVQFLVNPSGSSLAVTPADKKSFRAHRVPKGIYDGRHKNMEINSIQLCTSIANQHGWISGRSYRVPGIVSPGQRVAVFDLTKAKMIERDESQSYHEQQ